MLQTIFSFADINKIVWLMFLGQQTVLFIPQRKYKQTTLTIVLPILILGWVSMMAILIPVKSGEKISFLIAIELGLVFIIATLDTNMVPAGRGFKLPFICWVVLINHITLLETFLFILFFQAMIFSYTVRVISYTQTKKALKDFQDIPVLNDKNYNESSTATE